MTVRELINELLSRPMDRPIGLSITKTEKDDVVIVVADKETISVEVTDWDMVWINGVIAKNQSS